MIRHALLGAIAAAAFLTEAPGASTAGAKVALPPELRAAIIAETKGPVVNYAGKVPGTNAYIGLATRGEFVEVYVCDSDKIAVWLKGTSKGGTVSASNATNDVVFKATLKGSSLAGNLMLRGKTIGLTTVKAQL
jgi:hypothetical protein